MQITINLPDELAQKIQEKWGDISKIFFADIVLKSFLEGLIDFDEFKNMLNFSSDAEFKEFLKQKNMLHSGGIINLYSACADIEYAEDDLEIPDDKDDVLIGAFDE